MDADLLRSLGQVAGIGGVSLGIFLLVFREVIRKDIFPALKKDHAYSIIRTALYLAWSVALAGLLAWVVVAYFEMPEASTPVSQGNREKAAALQDEIAKLHERDWRDESFLRIPLGWSITGSETMEIRPPSGSLFDRVGLEIDVFPNCGYQGEAKYFNEVLSKEDGFGEIGAIFGFEEQREALRSFYPEKWEGWKTIDVISLRYKVLFEDGETIEEEDVQVIGSSAEKYLRVPVFVRTTDLSDLYGEKTVFNYFSGYYGFDCRATRLTGKEVAQVCKALLEGTLMFRTLESLSCGSV